MIEELNAITLEIFKNKFSSIAEEMGVVLFKTAFSPNIKERKDHSCAIFDKNGDMIAQAAHIPVHLGSMPLSVKSAISRVSMNKGDMVFLNDPFMGGTHLPDITMVAPVFIDDEILFYVANRAHHADIGGISAGSMPLSSTIFQEGMIIPPTKLIKKGKLQKDILNLVISNVRTPVERQGDFEAQIMANLTGIKRLKEISSLYGKNRMLFLSRKLIEYSENIMRKTIQMIPNGKYSFEDYLDDDGLDTKKININVRINITNDEVIVDFSGSHAQVKCSINAVKAITLSAVLYVFRSLTEEDIPTNAGCLRPIEVIIPEGTVVDAKYPCAVAGGNVETSQRVVDVLLGALSKAIPDVIPAASQGTMNNLSIGGYDNSKKESFTYYETIGGGNGASKLRNGESGIHSHMTNTMNTPIEAIEFEYPLRVKEYRIRKRSGGDGIKSGGDGIIRKIEVLCDAEVTLLSERRFFEPYGLKDGNSGSKGVNKLQSGKILDILPGKFHRFLKKGDIIHIETPGGGGYGNTAGDDVTLKEKNNN
ncbi:MAG: hydantoinase B/oxoprolinase family protein [Petrotogales bacterium]